MRRVLTVGDGDLSYSLALARCYGPQIELTATTLLPNEAELTATYSRAAAILAELLERGVAVRFGVDATALSSDLGPQDDIAFAHPHLGHADRGDAAHARRHTVLVAHFLRSAADLLAPGGAVHLTLCGNQPRVWAVEASAERNGLSLRHTRTPSAASDWPELRPEPAQPEWAARRRFRASAGREHGLSSHWLGAYGYEHRRTEGDEDMRVDNTVEIVLTRTGGADVQDAGGDLRCAICGLQWPSAEELATHVQTLALPDVHNATPQSSSTPPPDEAAAAVNVPRCAHCNAEFASRNLLFRHLREVCDPDAARERENAPQRVAVCVAYVGTGFHGLGMGSAADEAVRPTVEGAVLAAARRVWGDGASGVTRTAMTEKGAHALENLLVLSLRRALSPDGSPPPLGAAAAAALDAELRPLNIRVVSPSFALPGSMSELKRAARRLHYRAAIPFTALLTPAEREAATADVDAATAKAVFVTTAPWRKGSCSLAGGSGGAVAAAGGDAASDGSDDDDDAATATDGGDPAALFESAAAIAELLTAAGVDGGTVELPECGGFAEVGFADAAAAAACVAALDGRAWRALRLIAMPLAEARAKLAVHARVKAVLHRIRDGGAAIAAAPAATTPGAHGDGGGRGRGRGGRGRMRARALHNFTSEKQNARAPTAQYSLARCSSGIQGDLRLGSDWRQQHRLVVAYAAKAFAPEQLRRMTGVLVAVVSGAATAELIDRCFEPTPLPTPRAPAGAFWLDAVTLPAAAEEWRRLNAPSDAAALEAARRAIEGALSWSDVAEA